MSVKPKKKAKRIIKKAARKSKSRPIAADKPAATVLVMRTCAADMSSHGGFVWPASGPVECPDWRPIRACGNGLHGCLWGVGDASLLNWGIDAKWLVVEVPSDSVVDLNGKVKFPRGVVIYCGDLKGAAEIVQGRAPAGTVCFGGTATAGTRGTATAGMRGTATAGYAGTATAGYAGTATAGMRGTATAGDEGTATAGDEGTATAGYAGTATAGMRGTATAGMRGTATAGDEGSISIFYYDSTGKYRRLMGLVGKDGLEPNVAYVVNDGKFVKKATK